MIPKQAGTKRTIKKNNIFILLTVIYTTVLIIIGSIACFFAYQQKKEELLSQMDITAVKLEQKYLDTVSNFWQIYMPIFESDRNFNTILSNYFLSDLDKALEPLEKLQLSDIIMQMMMRDDQVQWIALYSDDREFNYILFRNSRLFKILPDDFPYLKRIESKSSGMEIYSMEKISDGSNDMNTYAICGGALPDILKGNIIAGYSTSELEDICNNTGSTLKSLNYILFSNNEILFDSSGTYDRELLYLPENEITDRVNVPNGEKLYVKSDFIGYSTILSYNVSWREIFHSASRYTLYILMLVLLFVLLSIPLYTTILQMISKEVNIVRHGLEKIGANNLDYRIPVNFNHDGFSEIAESINHMALRLKTNINRAYYYEIKQKEAELSELQAKFNPHFLYNSLEMLRSKCYKNGDADTANLITQLSAIFRGFIGSKTFIPIKDELAFSKRYLALFGARYGDKVQVRYDIDTEVLQYGIIRNVFQPLIENYFIHGFDSSAKDNYIRFRGNALDDKTIMLSLEDNGNGMSDADIQQLNTNLQEPVQLDTDSYGLKNLHQRLHLFYGENCGLTIARNEDKGLSFKMILLKLTCEEYEQSRDSK